MASCSPAPTAIVTCPTGMIAVAGGHFIVNIPDLNFPTIT